MGALEAVSKVIDAIDHATDNDPSTDPYADLKEAALELALPARPSIDPNAYVDLGKVASSLVMPKLDIETAAKYAVDYMDSSRENEQEREEQERIERENSKNLYSIKEPPVKQAFDPFENEIKYS